MAIQLITERKPQSSLIMIDTTKDRIRKHFRCVTCGHVVFDYYGGIKIIMPSEFDYDFNGVQRDEMTGEEVDWFQTLGVPFPIQCPGRLGVILPDGSRAKTRCKHLFFKIGI